MKLEASLRERLRNGHAHVLTLIAAARRCVEQTEQILQK